MCIREVNVFFTCSELSSVDQMESREQSEITDLSSCQRAWLCMAVVINMSRYMARCIDTYHDVNIHLKWAQEIVRAHPNIKFGSGATKLRRCLQHLPHSKLMALL